MGGFFLGDQGPNFVAMVAVIAERVEHLRVGDAQGLRDVVDGLAALVQRGDVAHRHAQAVDHGLAAAYSFEPDDVRVFGFDGFGHACAFREKRQRFADSPGPRSTDAAPSILGVGGCANNRPALQNQRRRTGRKAGHVAARHQTNAVPQSPAIERARETSMRAHPIRSGFRAVLAAATVWGGIVAEARGDELDYLPSGTMMLLSINVAHVMKSPLPRELTRLKPEAEKGIPAAVGAQYGIDLSNIARVTIATSEPGQTVAVITTIKPVTAAAIKAEFKPRPYQKDVKFQEFKVGAHTVYEQSFRIQFNFDGKAKEGEHIKGEAFCVVNDRLVVYGFLAPVKAVLERGPKRDASPGVTAALKQKGLRSTLTLVYDIAKVAAGERKYLKKDLAKLAPGAEEVFESFGVFTLRATPAPSCTRSPRCTARTQPAPRPRPSLPRPRWRR